MNIIKIELKNFIGKVELSFHDIYSIPKDFLSQDFIIAYYADERKSLFVEPKNPVKPDLKMKTDLKHNKVDQFLNFMVDCKVQEALARNEGKQRMLIIFVNGLSASEINSSSDI